MNEETPPSTVNLNLPKEGTVNCQESILLAAEVEEITWSKDAAIATVVATFGMNGSLHHWKVRGTSKRMECDHPDRNVGISLAIARAFERLSHQLKNQASGLVKHKDDVAAHHKILHGNGKQNDKPKSRKR